MNYGKISACTLSSFTCGLSAKKLCPTLVIDYMITLLYLVICRGCTASVGCDDLRVHVLWNVFVRTTTLGELQGRLLPTGLYVP